VDGADQAPGDPELPGLLELESDELGALAPALELGLDPLSPPPRETAVPPVRSAPEPGSLVADPACAEADTTDAANAVTNAPISNLPRVMDTLLNGWESNQSASGRQ